MKTQIFAFILFSLSFVACNENIGIIPVKTSPINDLSYDSLGVNHNRIVMKLYSNLDFTLRQDSVLNQLHANIDTIYFEELDNLTITRDSFNQELYHILDLVEANQANGGYGFSYYYPNTKLYLDSLAGIVMNMSDSSTVYSLVQQIENVENLVNASDLTDDEKGMVLGTADLLAGSIKLWFPSNLGGDDLMNIVLGTPDARLSDSQKELLLHVIIADASALEVSIGHSLYVIIASGGTAAIPTMGAILIQAAASSTLAGILSWVSRN